MIRVVATSKAGSATSALGQSITPVTTPSFIRMFWGWKSPWQMTGRVASAGRCAVSQSSALPSPWIRRAAMRRPNWSSRPSNVIGRAEQRARVEGVEPELGPCQDGGDADLPHLEHWPPGHPLHDEEGPVERAGIGRRREHPRRREAEAGDRVLDVPLAEGAAWARTRA